MENELDSAVVDKKALEVCPNLTLKLPDLVQLMGCFVPSTLNLLPSSTCCYVLDFHTVFFAQPPSYVTKMWL